MSATAVPEFPESRKIALTDRDLLTSLLEKYPAKISEATFGSIYIWRNYEGRSELSLLDGHLVVSWFRARFGRLVLPPVGPDVVEAVDRLIAHEGFRASGFSGVFGLTEPAVSALRARGKTLEPLRDERDYVYRTDDLIKLEGPRYHTQRKELSKATSEHSIVFEPMTHEHRDACLELEETWCDMKHCTLDRFSAAEDSALKEALDNMDQLGFFGGVALIDGKIQALTLGERLSKDTAVVHFEKANPSIRGLYQFINQEFCRNVLRGFEFVNREQDVGEPGLRRAKEGYHPHHFVEKHILLLAR
jgi:hypothetical protein